jgi:hypothetical protein
MRQIYKQKQSAPILTFRLQSTDYWDKLSRHRQSKDGLAI